MFLATETPPIITALQESRSGDLAAAPEPLVSIVIVNTNELHHLRRCLPAIFAQRYANFELLVIDNVSTDGSLEWVGENFPLAKIVRNGANLGYAGANNVGFEHAQGEYVAVLNPDTEVGPEWLNELVAALEADPQAGLATPKVVHMNRPDIINACGNEVTFTGLTFCRGLDQPISKFSRPERVSAVSGAAFVIRRSLLEKIGPFDESFFIYYEDTDLSLRALLAGYQCLFVPSAVVRHLYVFKLSPNKCFYQERNRYYSLLKTLRWPTLFILLPAFVLSECIVWGYLLLRGPAHMLGKLKSYWSLVRGLPGLLAARRKTQRLRQVSDHQILSHFGYRLTLAQTASPWLSRLAASVFNPLIFTWGAITRLIVRW